LAFTVGGIIALEKAGQGMELNIKARTYYAWFWRVI
jgi:hypothetical protein